MFDVVALVVKRNIFSQWTFVQFVCFCFFFVCVRVCACVVALVANQDPVNINDVNFIKRDIETVVCVMLRLFLPGVVHTCCTVLCTHCDQIFCIIQIGEIAATALPDVTNSLCDLPIIATAMVVDIKDLGGIDQPPEPHTTEFVHKVNAEAKVGDVPLSDKQNNNNGRHNDFFLYRSMK